MITDLTARIVTPLVSLWKTLFRRDELERELDDEIAAAIEILQRQHEDAGMNAAAARRLALRHFSEPGGIVRIKADVDEGRIGAGLDALRFDLRYVWRGLRTSQVFTATIVVTMAISIRASTAIFSVVHAMLVDPLPYRDADRLAFVWLDRTVQGYARSPLSGPDLADLREKTRTFESFAGIWSTSATTTFAAGQGEAEQLRVSLVTANFFDVLGSPAAIGRTFRPADADSGAQPTILLAWELFERRFGGRQSSDGPLRSMVRLLW